MNYQQRVYHWMLRYPDPVTMHEICRGTNLPPLVVSYALHRMHKRLGLVRPNRSNGGRGIKWLVVDDTITFIPDNRGMTAGSRAALVPGGKRVDKAAEGRVMRLDSHFSHARVCGGILRPEKA